MNVPDIIGVEVMTPDGRGSILTLHPKRVIVSLNTIQANQIMKGQQRAAMHYAYEYKDVEVIKGRYCFDENEVKGRYGNY